jgi:hypothetical protein
MDREFIPYELALELKQLINFKMKHEIIYTEYYAVIARKLTSPGKEGQVFLTQENIVHSVVGYNYGDRLVIAHRPLADAPILEGVPLLPEFAQEDDVEKKSRDFVKEIGGSQEQRLAFIDGYLEAKETYKYTVNDMIACWKYASVDKHQIIGGQIGDHYLSFIQSLQQPKRPKYFECETIYRVKSGTIQEHKDGLAGFEYYEPNSKLNSQGQTELVGEYIF